MSEGKKLVSIRGLTVSSAHRVLIKSIWILPRASFWALPENPAAAKPC